MADKKISALVDGGTPQATDEFVIARAGDNYKLDYASIESEALTDAVILAPATDARNVIEPTAGTVIPITIRGAAGQSDALLVIEDSALADLVSVGPTGAVTISPSDTAVVGLTDNGGAVFDSDADGNKPAIVALDTGGFGMAIATDPGDQSYPFKALDDGSVSIINQGASTRALRVRQKTGSTAAALLLEAGTTGTIIEAGEVAGAPALGFLGATPAAQPAAPTTMNEVVTALQTLGLTA